MPEPEEVQLPPRPQSVPMARHFVTRLLPQWFSAQNRDRVVLAVSETVSNAIQASGKTVTVRVFRRRPMVRIEVDDEDQRTADLSPRQASDDAEGGRGLLLVDAVTDDWGVTHHPGDGKTLWFHIAEPDHSSHPPESSTGSSAAGSLGDAQRESHDGTPR